ncbi:hypothetical protein RND71_006424 [Anisodus tanguticus]|uniref:Uncharacterized protein n=1 Tax=Anisodus tanguticus TaxID=243964 RepID=A0AAE1STB0_9SOLA|nr:hypothetical protein RND71_006424 [Anisodus tanguticus]
MCTCVFRGMASAAAAPPFPTSLFSPRRTAQSTHFLPLVQLQGKRSNFNTFPLSHFSIKCSSSSHGSTADDNFFQENKELDVSLSKNQESKGFWKK